MSGIKNAAQAMADPDVQEAVKLVSAMVMQAFAPVFEQMQRQTKALERLADRLENVSDPESGICVTAMTYKG